MSSSEGGWLIVVTFLLALLMQAIPMPYDLLWARPQWLCIVVIYWAMATPQRVGVGVAWLMGLILDGINGSLLGQHAIAMAVVAYIALVLYQRIRMFVVWQQAFIIFILIGVEQLLSLWIQSLHSGSSPSLLFLLPALISALLWPALVVLLRGLRRRYGDVKHI